MIKKLSVIFLALVLIATALSGCSSARKEAAVEAYNRAYALAEEKNKELSSAISAAENEINPNEPAYDENALVSLQEVIKKAKSQAVELPAEQPSSLKDIIAVTEDTLEKVDYSQVLKEIEDAESTYKGSVEQMKKVTRPDDSLIIEKLEKFDGITEIAAATEKNDPNGRLGKPGGYTAQVFFSHSAVNQSAIPGNNIFKKGTACGGSIEVYSTFDEAKARNEYLASFDNMQLDSGTHTVCGTMVIRLSGSLDASQRQELEKEIINSFFSEE